MSKRAVAKVSLEDLSIHLLHRAVQRADDIFADNVSEANLTPTQYAVLVGVAQSADLSQTDLVEVTGSDQTTLSEVVRRLLKKGLLQRRRRKEDTRKYAVRLTEAGRQVLQAAEPRVLRAEVEVLARLTGNQRRAFVAALKVVSGS
jgi:MarR family transcriptional regulator, temperature-dependent positive regulator of motility